MSFNYKKVFRDSVRFFTLLVFDLSAFYLSIYLAFVVRSVLGEVFESFAFSLQQNLKMYTIFWGLPLLFVLVLLFEGLYNQRRDFWDDMREFLKALVIYFFLIFTVLSMTKSITRFSRGVLLFAMFFLIFLFPIFRTIANHILFKIGIRENCVFIGDETSFKTFTESVLPNKYVGFTLGEPADYVFLSSKVANFERKLLELQQIFRYVFIFDDANYYLVSEFKPVFPLGKGITMFELQNKLLDPKRKWIKRVLELIICLSFMPFLLPLIVIIVIAIVLDSDGPVFYKQERVGKDGKIFKCIKFRTMYKDADKKLQKLLEEDPAAREEWNKYYKLRNDPRITRVGKFLRKTSLDELPQIFNILIGDMSLIGPRPVLKSELEKYYGEFSKYYMQIRPGLTGLWQVSGRNELDYSQRVKLDVWYVLNWSLWLDFVIFLKTFKVILTGRGAY